MKTVYKIIALLVTTISLQFCSKSVEYANSTSTSGNNTSTGTGSGQGANGPSINNPASTPYSTGQAGVYFPTTTDTTKKDTSKSKVPAITISYTKTSPCSSTGETFNFVSVPNSYIPAGTTYIWYLGVGGTPITTSTVSGYSYIYANTYKILLQAIYGGNVIATKDTTVRAYGTVYVRPTPSFTITQPLSTNPNYIVCTNTTQSNVSYSSLWSFGDSHMSAASSPTWTYGNSSTTQTYQVLLTTRTDSTGCTDTVSHFVTIPATSISTTPTCYINYTQTDSCGPGQETFNFSAVVTGVPSNSTYTWSFGDGTFNTGTTASKQYTLPSNYNITLAFSNLSLTCSQIISAKGINTFPTANFTYSANTTGNIYTFQDNTTLKTGNILYYYWDFGDGSKAYIAAPVHTYPKSTVANQYNILYIVKAANNCFSTYQKTVLVPSN